jgi:hypothetical protein
MSDRKGTPPVRPYAGDEQLDRLLKPARYFVHPTDVVSDPTLAVPEKRAILSSWASAACAAEWDPTLSVGCRPPSASFDEVVDALHRLDDAQEATTPDWRDIKSGRGSNSPSA